MIDYSVIYNKWPHELEGWLARFNPCYAVYFSTEQKYLCICIRFLTLRSPIILKFCVASVLYTEFQIVWEAELDQHVWKSNLDIYDERNFVRLEFKVSFSGLSYFEIAPGMLHNHYYQVCQLTASRRTRQVGASQHGLKCQLVINFHITVTS